MKHIDIDYLHSLQGSSDFRTLTAITSILLENTRHYDIFMARNLSVFRQLNILTHRKHREKVRVANFQTPIPYHNGLIKGKVLSLL